MTSPRTPRASRLVLSVGALALTGSVAACGSSGPGDPSAAGGEGGADCTAEVWALQDSALEPILTGSIERFNADAATGSAALQTFGNDPYKQRLRVALGSPNAPDVFFNWGGGNLKEYVDAGAVQDLTPLLDENPELQEAFLPSVLEAAQLEGSYYGIPMRGMQPVLMFYNQEVLDRVGVEQPQTWEELLAAVDALNAAGVTPIALAGSQAWTELMWFEYLLDRIGGPEVFQAIRDGEPGAWEQPEVVQALEMIRELVDRGAFGDDFASVGYDIGGASTILAQGEAGMHLMGSWEYTNQLGQEPGFVEAGGLTWGPFPAVEGGEGDPANVVGNPTNFYSISSASDCVEAAEDFVETQMTSDEYVSALIEAGDIPAVAGIREQLEAAPNSEYTTYVYDLVSEAPDFQLSWDQDIPADEATAMLTELQRVFLGEQTPEGFVQTMTAL